MFRRLLFLLLTLLLTSPKLKSHDLDDRYTNSEKKVSINIFKHDLHIHVNAHTHTHFMVMKIETWARFL